MQEIDKMKKKCHFWSKMAKIAKNVNFMPTCELQKVIGQKQKVTEICRNLLF